MLNKKFRGFTLIELMIAIAIVAILAGVAYPNYKQYVRKGKRADAKEALLNVQMAQEKWRANNATYGTLVNIGVGSSSSAGYYTVGISGTATATDFVATATATPNTGDQYLNDKEKGVACNTMVLTVNTTNPSGLKTPTACW